MIYAPSLSFVLVPDNYTVGQTFSFTYVEGETEVIQINPGQTIDQGQTIEVNDTGPVAVYLSDGTERQVGNMLAVVSSSRLGSFHSVTCQYTRVTDYLADDLDTLSGNSWPPSASAVQQSLLVGNAVHTVTVADETSWSIAASGVRFPSWFDDYYNRIHITPNPIDFGPVFSEQGRTINVWNAFLHPVTLESLTGLNAFGLTLEGQETIPTPFGSLQERNYSLALSLDGPPVIESSFVFDFGTDGVQSLLLSGTRVTVFPVEPNWKQPVLERLEWLTDVLEKRSGKEQRFRMRQNPRQIIEYEVLPNAQQARILNNLLFGWQGRMWGLPVWFQAQTLNSALSSGVTEIPCNTSDYEFSDGGFAILFLDYKTHEALTIQSVNANSITVTTPTSSSWPRQTRLMPMRPATLRDAVKISRVTADVGTGVFQFISEEFRAPVTQWANAYDNLPVLTYEANRVNDVSESWERRLSVLDNQIGPSTVIDKHGFSTVSRAVELLGVNLPTIKQYRNLFYYLCGRWKPFWAASLSSDIILAENYPTGQEYLIVEWSAYALMVKQNILRSRIRIQLQSGAVYYRRILASDDTTTPENTERLILDQSLPVDLKVGAAYISFITVSRLDTDAVEIRWITPTVANFSLSIKGVKT